MYALVRIWALMFALTACTGMGGLDGATQTGKGESTSDPSSTDGKGGAGDSVADAPVPVGGAYLVCAADYPLEGPVSEQMYGCRLDAEGKKVGVPTSATADLRLYSGANSVESSTALAAPASPWSWIVKTKAKGPFQAELTLRNVTISSTNGLVINPGSSSYRFSRVAVEGSSLQLVPNGGVLANAILNGQTTGDLLTLGYATAFPKYAQVSGIGGAAATTPFWIKFPFSDNTWLRCRYEPAPIAAYYVLTSDCRQGTGTDAYGPADGTPKSVSLDELIVGGSLYLIELPQNGAVSDILTARASVREFAGGTP